MKNISRLAQVFATALLLSNTAIAATIQDVKAAMGNNEALLFNAPTIPKWSKGAIMSMGSKAQGSATPVWWTPSNPKLKNDDYWQAMVPWFVIYPGINHSARNTKVLLSNVKAYVFSKSQQRWQQINAGREAINWAANYQYALINRVSNIALKPNIQQSFKLQAELYPVHGSTAKISINPKDIQEVLVTMESQLVVDNPRLPDDRRKAELLVSIGADYYPTMTSTVADFAPMGYVPAVGAARFEIVKANKRLHTFTTFDFKKCEPNCEQNSVYQGLKKLIK